MKPRITTLLVVATAAMLGPPAVAQAAGELTQKPGTAGCISQDTAKGECRIGKGLEYAQSVAVSPDGKNAYVVASGDSEGVAILDRDPATGALTQRTDASACVTRNGNDNKCQAVASLAGASDVAVSPDGFNVYVTGSGGITIFDRDPGTGALDQKPGKAGCISKDGSGDTCEKGVAIAGASSVVVSHDGKSVYVAAYSSGAVAIFDRDTDTGALTQKPGKAGCIAEDGGEACQDGRALAAPRTIAVSPDGRSVYAATYGNLEVLAAVAGGSLAVLKRDPATGALAQEAGAAGCLSYDGSEGACQSTGIEAFYDVTVSPDGRSAYVSSVSDGAIAQFDRDAASSALTQRPGIALGSGASELTVSPDGRNLYAAVPESGTVKILGRDATGALTLRTGAAGCVSETGSAGGCVDGRGLAGVWAIAVSPDGRNVYSASTRSSAVAIFDRAQPAPPATPQADRLAPTVSRFSLSPKRLRAGGRARVRFSLSEPADVRIVIERTRPGKRRVVRTLSLRGRAGVNTVRVRLRGRGRYRATITATDAAGNRSGLRRAGFQLVRRPAR